MFGAGPFRGESGQQRAYDLSPRSKARPLSQMFYQELAESVADGLSQPQVRNLVPRPLPTKRRQRERFQSQGVSFAYSQRSFLVTPFGIAEGINGRDYKTFSKISKN